jgi:hypothetical protein
MVLAGDIFDQHLTFLPSFPPSLPCCRLLVGEIKTDEGHDEVERKVQAARCMDCGTPFCQTHTG